MKGIFLATLASCFSWGARATTATSASCDCSTSDRQVYQSLKAQEFSDDYTMHGSPPLGVEVFEKATGEVLCQKYGSTQAANDYTYTCFDLLQTSSMESIYNALNSGEANLAFTNVKDGSWVLGIVVKEKRDGNILCRKTAPLVANPTYTYACFTR